MNKDQGNYFRMFLNTQKFLDDNTTTWSTIPKIVTYKNSFDELISRISVVSAEAAQILGVGNRKDMLKAQLGIKVSSLSGILKAFAHDNNNPDLAKAADISKSEIDKAKEQNLEGIVKAIVKLAQDNLAGLADFGTTEGTLTEILTTLEEFKGLIGKPRNILNEKYVKLDSLEALFKKTNELLKLNMDNVMLMFRETNPEFYNGYQRAREIVDM